MTRGSMTTALLLTALATLGCEAEAERDELPEVAEVEVEPDEGELELNEELVLAQDDVGETIMATGWVTGIPLGTGFFLRTEGNRVIFVESTETVSTGAAVRVTGPLMLAEALVLDEWEADAFERGFEAEWEVETTLFIDADTVEPM